MTFDPRGFEKAMKRTVCPHYGDAPVCWMCEILAESDACDLREAIEADERENARRAAYYESFAVQMAEFALSEALICRPEFVDYARFVVAAVLADARKSCE